MDEKSKARLAVVGVGVMGSSHVRDIANMDNAQLAAVCDIDHERADRYAAEYHAPAYYDYRTLLEQVPLDGIVIATPHYDHTPISIDAMKRGINVLTEKPIAVHAKDARKMIQAYEASKQKYPDLVFAIMFMQRTYGFWQKIKAMIDGGELGKLVRTSWIITDWFRTQTYYNMGGWRATWRGEGGGVLLNQCPHNLDLYQWFTGMPKRVAGFASIGKYHNIEVEDEVTGYFEYENGMVGHFITTTAESPGTNRLEIVGEKGKLVFENGVITFVRNTTSMLDFIKTSPAPFATVENETIIVPYTHHGEPGHRIIIQNFANAILYGEPVIVPATEGIKSVSIGNAIMLSSFQGKPVDLPLDEDAYEARLKQLISTSRYQKPGVAEADADLDKSFSYH